MGLPSITNYLSKVSLMEAFKNPQLVFIQRSTFHLHTSGMSKHMLYKPSSFISKFDAHAGSQIMFFKIRKGSRRFFNAYRDLIVKTTSLSISMLPRYTKEYATSSFFSSTHIACSIQLVNPGTGSCITTVFFRLISKPKVLHACTKRFLKRCISSSECVTKS